MNAYIEFLEKYNMSRFKDFGTYLKWSLKNVKITSKNPKGKMTQKQFADVIGYRDETIRRWIYNISIPRADSFGACAIALSRVRGIHTSTILQEMFLSLGYDFLEGEKNMIRPTSNHVVIRQNVAAETTASGLITGEKVKPFDGEVIAVGKECLAVSVGQTVIFAKFSGTELEIDGVEYLIIRETELLAIKE